MEGTGFQGVVLGKYEKIVLLQSPEVCGLNTIIIRTMKVLALSSVVNAKKKNGLQKWMLKGSRSLIVCLIRSPCKRNSIIRWRSVFPVMVQWIFVIIRKGEDRNIRELFQFF